MINNEEQLTLTYAMIKVDDSQGFKPNSAAAAISRATAAAVSDASKTSISNQKMQDTNMYEE